MAKQNEGKNQLEKANQKLSEMRADITTGDRKAAFSEFGCDNATLSLYLNNKGRSLDTAMKYINFFSARIEERKKQLA